MPFNITNDIAWIDDVRGVLTSDQVEGGPGGVANFSAVDLTKRTNWLKEQVDLLGKLKFSDITATRTLLANEVGTSFRFKTAVSPDIATNCRAQRAPGTLGGTDDFIIRFNPPTNPGVTSIQVEYRATGGSGPWIAGTGDVPNTSPQLVPGLIGTAYDFRIKSVGGTADGALSAVFTIATVPTVTVTAATLPAISSVAIGTGFHFSSAEGGEGIFGRVFANGSEIISADELDRNFVFVKPGRDGFWIIRQGSAWRLVRGENHRHGVGKIEPFATPTAPLGYLACDGAAISRASYLDLFEKIGTTFGAGDGSTTFNLPELRGEFIRGLDGGRGIDTGRVLGSAQASTKFNGHIGTQPGSDQLAQAVESPDASETYSFKGRDGTSLAGSNYNFTKSTVRPRNVALPYYIKY